MKSIITKLTAIAFLSILLSLSACKDDSSTNPKEDDMSSTAIAENNTLVSPENIYKLESITIFHQAFVKQFWITLESENKKDANFLLKLKSPLPTDNSGKMEYMNDRLGFKDGQFEITELYSNKDSEIEQWQTAGRFGIATKGTLYYKKNDNNTITFWTNNLELSNATENPTKSRKFSFKFTYSLDLVAPDNSAVVGKVTNE